MNNLLQGSSAQKLLLSFHSCPYVLRVFVVLGILGLLALCFTMPLTVAAELSTDIFIQVEIADKLPNFSWEQSRIKVFLLDDRHNLSRQLTDLQEESKAQLEPLIKEYMYTAELLTRLAAQKEKAEERTEALLSFHEQETQIQRVLDGYAAQIDRIFQEQTLQIRREEGQAVERIEFHDIPPGKYRVYAVLTFATTTLQWFEALSIEGGDTVLCALTRENRHNPYWTDLNWWSFINLDFSKHH
jgi:hypothetical protein